MRGIDRSIDPRIRGFVPLDPVSTFDREGKLKSDEIPISKSETRIIAEARFDIFQGIDYNLTLETIYSVIKRM